MSKEIKGNMSTFLFLLVSRACLRCETQAFLFFLSCVRAKMGWWRGHGGWVVVEYDECEKVFSGWVL